MESQRIYNLFTAQGDDNTLLSRLHYSKLVSRFYVTAHTPDSNDTKPQVVKRNYTLMSSAQTALLLNAAEPLPEPGCRPAHGPRTDTKVSNPPRKKHENLNPSSSSRLLEHVAPTQPTPTPTHTPPLHRWVIGQILEIPPMDDLIRLSGNCWF